jgi:hypothetical protein
MTAYETKDSGARAEFDSGMKRDTEDGKARFDLLLAEGVPYEAQLLTRFAELMARGAVKYSVPRAIGMSELVGCCSCERQAATLQSLTTLRDSAEAAMRQTFADVMQALPSDSAPTGERGAPSMPRESRPASLPTARAAGVSEHSMPSTADGLSLDSLQRMATDYLLRTGIAVPSASTSTAREDLTPTMTTPPALLEGFYVHVVTRALGSSATRLMAFGEHSSTCSTHRLRPSLDGPLLSNDRNWEKASGPDELERFRSSALRHLQQWAAGEDDEDHAAAVMFNLLGHESTLYKISVSRRSASTLPDIAAATTGTRSDDRRRRGAAPVPARRAHDDLG